MRPGIVFPVAVGLVVAAAVALVLGASRPSQELTLVLDEALGLTEGSEVRSGGLTVGQVSSIALGADGFPRVGIELDGDVRARRGARAAVVLFSAAARERRIVTLEPGAGPELPDDAVLGRDSTDTPVETDAALSTLDPATRRDVRVLIERTESTLRVRGPAIDRTLARSAEALGEAARLSEDVTHDGQALRTIVSEGARVSRAVARQRGALGGAVEGLGVTLETTARREREVGATLAALPPTLRATRGALARADGVIPELRALTRAARPGARELVPTARVLRPTLRAARPALAEGRRLVGSAPPDLVALDGLLREVRPLVGPARSALNRANPMLDQLRVRTPDAAGFVTGFADAGSNFDRGGHGLRIGFVFAEPPRRPVGPSEAEPGRLERPFTRTPGVLEDEPWRSFRSSFVGGGR
jgi:phospholipid/cholesterol/gamma-HCH transport system substrate-binding protein